MLGHKSAAMTLDIYADLFDSDIDAVAENVSNLWPGGPADRVHRQENTLTRGYVGAEGLSSWQFV